MATNLFQLTEGKDQSYNYNSVRTEIIQRFKKIREEIDKKEIQLLAQIDAEFSKHPLRKAYDLIWHQTNLSLALESLCEIVERMSNTTNSLDKTQNLWESSPHGSNRNNLSGPTSFSICPETNKIYVADKGNRRISCFDENGTIIRVRDLTKTLSSWTPDPELIICNSFYKLIWIYATDRPQLFHFVAINTCDLSEKYNIKGVPQVKALTINPDTHRLKYFSYNTEDHSITYGDVDPIIENVPLPNPKTIWLESPHLEESKMDVQLSVLDKFIFVLYRDTKYRILKFDFTGRVCENYLPCEDFGIVECFFLISQNYFLLAKIGTTPINQVTKQSIFSPEKKGQDCLQVCMVSSEGEVRGQLSYPIAPHCGDMECSPIRCSQVILYNNNVIALLRACTTNLIAF